MMVKGEFSEDEVEKSSGSSEESESTPEPGEKKPKQSAPGEGNWSKREKRKAAIQQKDAEIYEQGQGSESWSKKRKRIHKDPMENSLAVILESLKGYEVTIDLKNDSTVTGKIESVDKGMNVILESVIDSPPSSTSSSSSSSSSCFSQRGNETIERTEIKGTSIFLVHMPSGLDINSHVEKHRNSKEKEKKARSIKTKSLTAQA